MLVLFGEGVVVGESFWAMGDELVVRGDCWALGDDLVEGDDCLDSAANVTLLSVLLTKETERCQSGTEH